MRGRSSYNKRGGGGRLRCHRPHSNFEGNGAVPNYLGKSPPLLSRKLQKKDGGEKLNNCEKSNGS